MTDYTVTVRHINGEPMLDAAGMRLLFGVTDEAIAEVIGVNPSAFPHLWIQQGRRRAREAMAHTGSTALVDALTYWARKEHGANLVLIDEGNG